MQSTSTVGVVSALLSLVLGASPALATSARTFVSGHGSDSGSCSITAPCRSFAYAISQTSPSGEIAVLDTAGYGAVTITQAISIVNPGGVEAGISAGSGTTAITINAGANDKVALRGLSLEGNGIGQHGIVFNSGASLDIADTVVRGFASDGIAITNGDASGGNIYLSMRNVISNDNGGSGIVLQITKINLSVEFNHVFGEHNKSYGLFYNSNYGSAQVVDSTFANNQSYDVEIDQSGLLLSQLSAGEVHIASSGGAIFTGSTIELLSNQGTCSSFGNNAIVYGAACGAVALR